MIDWLTLKVNAINLTEAARCTLRGRQSTLLMIDPNGSVSWERPCRDSVRSDSHQVTVEFGSDLVVYGSPARIMTNRQDNVFGSDDVPSCASAMLDHVSKTLGVPLPQFREWDCTRIDVTENYHLGTLTNVKEALSLLRHAEGGRFQVRTTAESVYWSTASTYRSGKAYAKGPHLAHLTKRQALKLSDEEMQAASGLLRLELSLRRHWFKRLSQKKWHELTASDLAGEHQKYFSKLVGDVELTEMSDIRQRLIEAAKALGMSEGMGRGAFASWQWIRSSGYADWRDGAPRSTFYRHKKIMFQAGLSYGDFQAGNFVAIRRRRVVLDRPVKSWAELRQEA